jgi:hypothetical protein
LQKKYQKLETALNPDFPDGLVVSAWRLPFSYKTQRCAGQFRQMSKAEASCVVGRGKDERGGGIGFWGKPLQ